ncbi:hypothetical protein CLOM_g13170, partial [Closterium sp. NIES-68]
LLHRRAARLVHSPLRKSPKVWNRIMQSAIDRRPARTPSQLRHGGAQFAGICGAPGPAPSSGAIPQPPASAGLRPPTHVRHASFPRSSSSGSGGKSSPPTARSYERASGARPSGGFAGGADLGARVAAAVAATAASAAAPTTPTLVAPAAAEVSAAAEAAESAAAAAAQRSAKARELMERLHQPTAHEIRARRDEAERREKARIELAERQRNEERRQQELVTRAAVIIATAGIPGAWEIRAERERREEERREQELREQEWREAEERRQREEERRQQLKNRAAAIVASAPSWEQTLQQHLLQQDATAELPLPQPPTKRECLRAKKGETSPLLSSHRLVMLQIDDATECNVLTVATTIGGSSRSQGAAAAERSPRSAPAFAAARSAGSKSSKSTSLAETRSFGAFANGGSAPGAPPPSASFLPPKSPAAATSGWGAASPREEVKRSPKGGQLSSSAGGSVARNPHGQQQRFHGQPGEQFGQKSGHVKKSVSFPDMGVFNPPGFAGKADRSSAIPGGNDLTSRRGDTVESSSGGDEWDERGLVGDDWDERGLVGDDWDREGLERRTERRRGGSDGSGLEFGNDWEVDLYDSSVATTQADVARTAVAKGWDREISLADLPDDAAPLPHASSPHTASGVGGPLPPSLTLSPHTLPSQLALHNSPHSPSLYSPSPHSPSPHTPSRRSPFPRSPSHDAGNPHGAPPTLPAPPLTRRNDSLPRLSPGFPSPHLHSPVPAAKARHAFPKSRSSAEADGSAQVNGAAEPERSPGWEEGVVSRARSLEARPGAPARACSAEAGESPGGGHVRVSRAKTVEGRIGGRGSGGGGSRGGGGEGREARGAGEEWNRGERSRHRSHSKSTDFTPGGVSRSTEAAARSQGNTAAAGEGKARGGPRPGMVNQASSAAEKAGPGGGGPGGGGHAAGRGGHRRAASWALQGETGSTGAEERGKSGSQLREGSLERKGVSAASASGSSGAAGAGTGTAAAAAAAAAVAAASGEAEADESGRWEEVRSLFFKSSRSRFVNLAFKGLSSFSKMVAAAGAAAAAGVGVGGMVGVGANVLGGEFEDVEGRYEVERGRELGAGQFGVTRVVNCRSTGRRLACKTINKAALKSKSDVENVRREVAILELLKAHPNVIRLEEAIESPQAIHLVMELCSGGELFDRIKERRRYGEREAARVMHVLLDVLHFAHHRHHVLHRDVKPENILLVSPNSHTDIRVIDFGVAAFHKPGSKPLSDAVGSLFYIAPEVIAGSYGTPADVWSAGVVLYVLLAGVPPFWAETEAGVAKAIKEEEVGFKGSVWRGVSDEGKDLILRMLDRDQKRRVSAQEALEHPWFDVCLESTPPDSS